MILLKLFEVNWVTSLILCVNKLINIKWMIIYDILFLCIINHNFSLFLNLSTL